jgi:hypothetical protein
MKWWEKLLVSVAAGWMLALLAAAWLTGDTFIAFAGGVLLGGLGMLALCAWLWK